MQWDFFLFLTKYFEHLACFVMKPIETTQGGGGYLLTPYSGRRKLNWSPQAMPNTQETPEDNTASQENEQ